MVNYTFDGHYNSSWKPTKGFKILVQHPDGTHPMVFESYSVSAKSSVLQNTQS